MKRYIVATFAGAAAIVGLTLMGAGTAQAAETTAAPSAVQPMTDPPGRCTKDELGDWKIDKFGIIHYCTYIPGEGYYWIPA